MIINRQNYQIWITDYYDGQLDDFQTEVLMDFLTKNPDLKSEFDEYPELFLKPEDSERYTEPELLKSPDQLSGEQVEHFSIALTENDLSEREENDIRELSKSDPRFRENIRIYEKIKLKPDTTLYPDKSSLLKIPLRRKATRYIINALSAAASIAILAGLFFILNKEKNTSTGTQIYAGSEVSKLTDSKRDNNILADLSDDPVRYIPPRTGLDITEAVEADEIVRAEPLTLPERTRLRLVPLATKKDIKLERPETHFLLAETGPYPEEIPPVNTDLSVREFLAYHFRKQVLDDTEPDIERLKAYEIADAGVKGFNKLLGWNMELVTEKSEEGRLNYLSFTSELIKFDHKSKKSEAGL